MQQNYDPSGRLSSQLAGQERSTSYPSPAHEKLAHVSRKYSWDKSGRLLGIKDNRRGTSSHTYDPRDQIVQITRITGINKQTEEKYNYDSLMNLAESNGRLHQYEGGTVRTVGKNSYRYDMRGRTIEKKVHKNGFRPKTWRYRWDDFDRLTEAHTPDGAIWIYSYDAFGRRIKKECIKPGEFGRKHIITHIWQGATLAEEWKTNTDGDDQPIEVSRWHFEPGTFNPIAKETRKYDTESTTGQFYPIVTDHLGTPKELFDTNGNCVWQVEHKLWGEAATAWRKQQNGSPLPLVDCSLRFQNQWEDEESGLYYNLNRYYDPDSGQYLSTDPIGLEGGLRTHGYVHDPMQWVDPMGLAGCPKPSVADEAASWQGKGKYPGVDKWNNTTLKKGTIVYGGTPGQSEFYTTKTAFERCPKKADIFGRILQVEPHRKYGYRKEMTAYEVVEDAPAARSAAKANPQFGEGGLSQVYIPDYGVKLKPLYKVILR